MASENIVVLDEWRFTMIVPFYKGKGERTECKNERSISLSMIGKIYMGVHKVTGGLIDVESTGVLEQRGCIDQIFTLGEKA